MGDFGAEDGGLGVTAALNRAAGTLDAQNATVIGIEYTDGDRGNRDRVLSDLRRVLHFLHINRDGPALGYWTSWGDLYWMNDEVSSIGWS